MGRLQLLSSGCMMNNANIVYKEKPSRITSGRFQVPHLPSIMFYLIVVEVSLFLDKLYSYIAIDYTAIIFNLNRQIVVAFFLIF